MDIKDLYRHLDKFTPIYHEGQEVNPIPEDVKVTIFCEGSDDEGFLEDIYRKDGGITLLIAKSWILQTDLDQLE